MSKSTEETSQLLSQQQIALLLHRLNEAERQLQQSKRQVTELERELLSQQQMSDIEKSNKELESEIKELHTQNQFVTELLSSTQDKLENSTQRVEQLEKQLVTQQQMSALERVNEELTSKADESNYLLLAANDLVTLTQDQREQQKNELEKSIQEKSELESENDSLLKALAKSTSTEIQLRQQLSAMRVTLG